MTDFINFNLSWLPLLCVLVLHTPSAVILFSLCNRFPIHWVLCFVGLQFPTLIVLDMVDATMRTFLLLCPLPVLGIEFELGLVCLALFAALFKTFKLVSWSVCSVPVAWHW